MVVLLIFLKFELFIKETTSIKEINDKSSLQAFFHMNTVQTIAYLNKNHPNVDSEQELSGLYQSFKKYGIKVSFPSKPEGKKRRFIFSHAKSLRFKGEIDEFISECNGLICLYDYEEKVPWSLLAKPVNTFKTGVNEKYIDRHLHKYTVYKVNEGTTVNMYYYNGSWRISSSRGYDVTELVWNGKKTYKEVLKEVLYKYSILYDEFLEALDKNASYTFGFKHPDFHPFWDGKDTGQYNFWFIQKFHNKDGVVPMGEKLKKLRVDGQTIEEKPGNIRTLFKKLGNSLDDFLETKNVLYGYILRTDHKDVSINSRNILLESRLLKTIRNLYYHSKYQKNSHELKLDREKYIVASAFLDRKKYAMFTELFPQYKNEFNEYEKIYKILLKELTGIYTKPGSTDSPFYLFAQKIANQINKKVTIKKNNPHLQHLLSTFILDPVFLTTFYTLRWDFSSKE